MSHDHNTRQAIAQAAAAYAIADAREAVRGGDPIEIEPPTSMTVPLIQELRPLARDDRHLFELFTQRIKELKAAMGA